MKNKVTKLIEENNHLREKLNPENLAYYEKFLTYFRMKNLVKNDLEVEETLMGILGDLLAAQEDDLSAEDYLGKNPEALADELLQNIPNYSFKEILGKGVALFGTFLLFAMTGTLFSPYKSSLVLGHWALILIAFLACIYGVFYLLAKSVYHQKMWLAYLPVVGFLALFLLIPLLVPPFGVVILGPVVKLLLLIIIFTGLLIYVLIHKVYEYLPLLIVLSVIAFGRLNFQIANWLTTFSGIIIGFSAVCLAVLLQVFIAKKRYTDKK